MKTIADDVRRRAHVEEWHGEVLRLAEGLRKLAASAREEEARYWREYRADMDPAGFIAARAEAALAEFRGPGAINPLF